MVTPGCFASRAQACASESVVVIGSMCLGFLADAGPGVAGQNIPATASAAPCKLGQQIRPRLWYHFTIRPVMVALMKLREARRNPGRAPRITRLPEQALHPGYGCPRTRGM